MNLKLLTAAIVAASSIAIAPGVARADDCTDSVSYIQVPGQAGMKCVNLHYMTTLGAARQNLKDINATYLKVMSINTGSTEYVTDYLSKNGDYTRDSIKREMAPEERKAIQQAQAQVAQSRDHVAVTTEEIEQLAFRIHVRALNAVNGTLARPRY